MMVTAKKLSTFRAFGIREGVEAAGEDASLYHILSGFFSSVNSVTDLSTCGTNNQYSLSSVSKNYSPESLKEK